MSNDTATLVTVREALSAARGLIENPEFWTQGDYAIENTGATVETLDDDAYAFCAVGALGRVLDWDPNSDITDMTVFAKAYRALNGASLTLYDRGIAPTNDERAPDVAHNQVLFLYDYALANFV